MPLRKRDSKKVVAERRQVTRGSAGGGPMFVDIPSATNPE